MATPPAQTAHANHSVLARGNADPDAAQHHEASAPSTHHRDAERGTPTTTTTTTATAATTRPRATVVGRRRQNHDHDRPQSHQKHRGADAGTDRTTRDDGLRRSKYRLLRPPRASPPPGAGFGFMYYVMRFIGERSQTHFFNRVDVVGGEDFPRGGPVIVCCTHFSTIMDVALISAYLPHRRPIHYWAKRGLYKRQPFRWILHSSGNIQVDRKTKNNQDLFAGTFEAMKSGEAIGLFPEGGSYTEHRLHSMKAGAAWAALEYAKHLILEGEDELEKVSVTIVPASINYTDKSRFRSEAVFEFGKAFSVDEYTAEFLSTESGDATARKDDAAPNEVGGTSLASTRSGLDDGGGETPPRRHAAASSAMSTTASSSSSTGGDGLAAAVAPPPSSTASLPSDSARSAVRRLTERIGAEIYRMTVDAPDWPHWHAAKMWRELVWDQNGALPLREFVPISNSIIAVLQTELPESRRALVALNELQCLSIAASTDIFTLNKVGERLVVRGGRRGGARARRGSDDRAAAPASWAELDAATCAAALPSTWKASKVLAMQVGRFVSRLPFTVPLMVVYAPAYVVGWALAYRYASHEEESMASAKALCAFVIAFLTHAVIATLVASLLLFTPPGWLLGACVCYAIERLHLWLLDDTYAQLKRLACAWRVWCASLPLPQSPSAAWLRHPLAQRACGGEACDAAVRLALEAVSQGPPIQWTLRRALREHNKRRTSGAPGQDGNGPTTTTMETPSASAKAAGTPRPEGSSGPTPLVRPWRAQLMGGLLAARRRALTAMRELGEALDAHAEGVVTPAAAPPTSTVKRDEGGATTAKRSESTPGNGTAAVTRKQAQAWLYLRQTTEASGAGKLVWYHGAAGNGGQRSGDDGGQKRR